VAWRLGVLSSINLATFALRQYAPLDGWKQQKFLIYDSAG